VACLFSGIASSVTPCRRNTSDLEVLMGRPAGWITALTGRSPMKSPGAPSRRASDLLAPAFRVILRDEHRDEGFPSHPVVTEGDQQTAAA
jgi:hypothetical protein